MLEEGKVICSDILRYLSSDSIFFIFILNFRPHSVILRSHSWLLYLKELLLARRGRPSGTPEIDGSVKVNTHYFYFSDPSNIILSHSSSEEKRKNFLP